MARATRTTVDELPIEESRHLVATRTGTIGYPDAHAIAVAECSLSIARRLEVEPEVRRTIIEGALLHDVGKLRVDERILSKPGTSDARRAARDQEAPDRGRAPDRRGSRPGRCRGRADAPRAVGRARLSRGASRPGDPAGRARRGGRRRISRDVRGASLPQPPELSAGRPGTGRERGHAVRSTLRRSPRQHRRGIVARSTAHRSDHHRDDDRRGGRCKVRAVRGAHAEAADATENARRRDRDRT